VHDVVQQAGFCAVGRGKFSYGKISLLESYPGNQLTKHTNNCFPTIPIED
jgi:hypothetical protein